MMGSAAASHRSIPLYYFSYIHVIRQKCCRVRVRHLIFPKPHLDKAKSVTTFSTKLNVAITILIHFRRFILLVQIDALQSLQNNRVLCRVLLHLVHIEDDVTDIYCLIQSSQNGQVPLVGN